MADYSEDYLLGKRVKILQPLDGYRASIDAVFLAAAVNCVKKGDTFLDAGSGTGAVSLCLAERFKTSNITVTGLEIQPQLAELSNLSARANGFASVEFINRSLHNSGLAFCSFGHVISNPPYSEKDFPSPNPGKATAHNFEGAGLTEWINTCIKMIKPQGYFYMVNRAEALEHILYALHNRMGGIRVVPLQSKEGQNAKRIIICARKDSKAPLTLYPPVVVHDKEGNYTPQAQRILRGGESLFDF